MYNDNSVTVSTVTLDSSSDSVCPGDTVVFTCTTDTTELVWSVGAHGIALLYEKGRENHEMSLSIFMLTVTNQTGNNFVSTATVTSAHLDYNGIDISCSDSSLLHISNTETKTVKISGKI